MSVAIMSPTQYELAYGDAVEIVTDVKKSINWTYSEILHNQTVKVYGSEKMHWRGECFLAAGTLFQLFVFEDTTRGCFSSSANYFNINACIFIFRCVFLRLGSCFGHHFLAVSDERFDVERIRICPIKVGMDLPSVCMRS